MSSTAPPSLMTSPCQLDFLGVGPPMPTERSGDLYPWHDGLRRRVSQGEVAALQKWGETSSEGVGVEGNLFLNIKLWIF